MHFPAHPATPALSAVEVTRLLRAWRAGDEAALERLTPLVYEELHRLARQQMAGERDGHVLQSSALVNEAYLRLLGHNAPVTDWKDRSHFFAVSTRLMRQILIDFARADQTTKRGNRAPHIELSAVWDDPPVIQPELLEVDLALQTLAKLDPRQAEIVQLRFFGGLEIEEIADLLGISPSTVNRSWRLARLWLYQNLKSRD
jgi:RNA polymerase sigma-70 factor, ECF subfamily